GQAHLSSGPTSARRWPRAAVLVARFGGSLLFSRPISRSLVDTECLGNVVFRLPWRDSGFARVGCQLCRQANGVKCCGERHTPSLDQVCQRTLNSISGSTGRELRRTLCGGI